MLRPQPFWDDLVVVYLVQVLASFLVQDLEAEGLNPFLLTYIANSLFIVYLPAYALAKHCASHGLKGRQALPRLHDCCEYTDHITLWLSPCAVCALQRTLVLYSAYLTQLLVLLLEHRMDKSVLIKPEDAAVYPARVSPDNLVLPHPSGGTCSLQGKWSGHGSLWTAPNGRH